MHNGLNIPDREFIPIQKLMREVTGINLTGAKKTLVMARLAKRLEHYRLQDYRDYFELIGRPGQPAELQIAVDLLTTNETHFFREPKHFDFVRERAPFDTRAGRPYRIWSAACSSGEEPYSLAMVLGDRLRTHWEVVASDISTRVLGRACNGQYPLRQARTIPLTYLNRSCLKGVGSQAGTFIVHPGLRERVSFLQVNLNKPLPNLGEFDMVFLRNVMIYFDLATKREVVGRILPHLRPGGYFIIGHAESLNGVTNALERVQPSIYRKAAL